jgi:hypothetical protein
VIFFEGKTGLTDHWLGMVSLATREVTVLVDEIPDFPILAADERHVAIGDMKPQPEVTIIDLQDRRSHSFCCFRGAWQGYFVGDELRLLARDGAETTVSHLDFTTGEVVKTTRLEAAAALVPWNGQLIALDQRRSGDPKVPIVIRIYDVALKKVAEAPIPPLEVRGNLGCQPGDYAVAQSKLAYVSGCGHINIVDVEHPEHQLTLPYFAEATYYSLAITGDLLLALPRGTGEPVAAFRVSDGQLLARLPVAGNRIAAAGNRLAAVEQDGRVALYELDIERLSNSELARASTIETCRKVMKLPRETPAQESLSLLRGAPIAPLLAELDRLQPDGLDCAHFYASQLARTIDRIEDGITLLEQLQAIKPDQQIQEDIATARARLALREDSDRASLAAARSAAELTFGTGANGLGPLVRLSGSRLFAWQWGDLGGAHMICATVSFYDRRDLQLDTIVPIAACDEEFQDSITSVVEGQGKIYVALEYRFEQKNRTDLVVLYGDRPSVLGRYQLMGGISSLVSADEGLIACPLMGECMLWDWTDLARPPKPPAALICPPQRTYGAPVVKTLPETAQAKTAHLPIACGEQFVAFRSDRGEQASIEIVDITRPDAPLTKLQAAWPVVAIDEAKGRAVISATNIETVDFQTVDLATGAVRREFSVRHDKDGGLPWAIHEDLLLVARGKDLLIHDLAEGWTIAYVKDLISPDHEHPSGGKGHRIQHLILDEDIRAFALTRDGHRSRVIDLEALDGELARDHTEWSELDARLRDSGRM